MYGSDALAGTVNIITNEPSFSPTKQLLYGFNGFYSSNENGLRGTVTLGGSSPRATVPRPGGRRDVRQLQGRLVRRRRHAAALRRRHAQARPTPSTRTSASPSARFPIRSTQPYVRTGAEILNSQAEGKFVNASGLVKLGDRRTLARPLPEPADGGRRLPGLRAAVLLQRHVAAAQQPRQGLGALRSAGDHAVAGQPVADRVLPAHRAPAADDAAGAVPGADRRRVLPDHRVPARHPVRHRAARVDAGRRPAGGVRSRREPRADHRPDVLSRSQQRPAHDDHARRRCWARSRSGPAARRRWCFPSPVALGPPSIAHPVRVPDASLRDIAVFAQDEWRVRPDAVGRCRPARRFLQRDHRGHAGLRRASRHRQRARRRSIRRRCRIRTARPTRARR